ncbi:MAG: hypothetical protein R2867_46320 [Caldilineaceae bacterium]
MSLETYGVFTGSPLGVIDSYKPFGSLSGQMVHSNGCTAAFARSRNLPEECCGYGLLLKPDFDQMIRSTFKACNQNRYDLATAYERPEKLVDGAICVFRWLRKS